MKIAFSLLAEAFRENGIRKVEAYITGGNPAEKSRTNAPVLFSEGKTYADSSEEINTPSGPVLVTTL
ncbi:MAG: hypothetical protein IT416_03600 [Candidatus Pacebacteria bacterium]|nr:hypothetical protein [Candidatus Paceibacterota bacterium]